MKDEEFELFDIVEPKISAGQDDQQKPRWALLSGDLIRGELRYQVRYIQRAESEVGIEVVYRCIAVARTGDIRGDLVNFLGSELVLSHPFCDDPPHDVVDVPKAPN